jgi:uncharacterized protein (TIGR03382 family)
MKIIAGSLLLVSSLAGAAHAGLANGSFESGDFRGWTIEKSAASPDAATVGLGSRGSSWKTGEPIFDYADGIATSNYSPGLPMPGAPTQGAHNAVFLQNGPSTVRLSQTVVIEPAAELSWDVAYHNWSAPGAHQSLRVTLHDPENDAVLATLMNTQDAMPIDMSMTHFAFDVSAFSGRRVVVAFEIDAHAGFLDVQLDDVQLTGQPSGPADDADRNDASLDETDDESVAVGGCSAGGGGAGFAAAAGLVALRRRRR